MGGGGAFGDGNSTPLKRHLCWHIDWDGGRETGRREEGLSVGVGGKGGGSKERVEAMM